MLNEAQGGFKFANASLLDEAKAQLDKLVANVAAARSRVLRDRGPQDSTDAATTNEMIGLAAPKP